MADPDETRGRLDMKPGPARHDLKTAKIGKGKAGPGRPKGLQNKTTSAVKDMILQALSDAGGADYLLKQSVANPTAFLTLVGKVLPLQIGGDPNNPVIHEVRCTIVHPRA